MASNEQASRHSTGVFFLARRYEGLFVGTDEWTLHERRRPCNAVLGIALDRRRKKVGNGSAMFDVTEQI